MAELFTREALREGYLRHEDCPVSLTLQKIGGKWKPIILYIISHKVKRFGEMYRMIEGISKSMLTSQLRELEADGIISRTIYPEIPPRVEYEMTEFGLTLRPIVVAMREWGLDHGAKIKGKSKNS